MNGVVRIISIVISLIANLIPLYGVLVLAVRLPFSC